jgi:hypothetical protein
MPHLSIDPQRPVDRIPADRLALAQAEMTQQVREEETVLDRLTRTGTLMRRRRVSRVAREEDALTMKHAQRRKVASDVWNRGSEGRCLASIRENSHLISSHVPVPLFHAALGYCTTRKRHVESSNSQDTPDRGFLDRTQHRQTFLLVALEILQHLGFRTFFCPGRGLPVDLDVSRAVRVIVTRKGRPSQLANPLPLVRASSNSGLHCLAEGGPIGYPPV